MKTLGTLLVIGGTIALFVAFPWLLIVSAIGWGIAFMVRARERVL